MKYLLTVIVVLFIANTSYSRDNEFHYEGAVSVLPWNVWTITHLGEMYASQRLGYSFEDTHSIVYEANFDWKALSFGASAASNNSLVRVRKVLGYIGIKGVTARVTQMTVEGNASWPGELGYDMSPEFEFSDKIIHYDLYWTYTNPYDGFKAYIGAGYSDITFPISFVTVNHGDNSPDGVAFYDDRFNWKFYGIVAGFDTLRMRPQYDGIGWFAYSYDRFNFIGKGKLSENAKRRCQAVNPGYTPVEESDPWPWSDQIECTAAFGLRYDTLLNTGWISYAAGIELAGGMFDAHSGQSAGGKDDGSTTWGQNTIYLRYGLVLRITGAW